MMTSPALAQGGFGAEIATPKRPYYETVIEDVAWRCDGPHCQTTSELSGASDTATCEALARQVGELASFNGYKGPLDPQKLAKCNKAAPSAK